MCQRTAMAVLLATAVVVSSPPTASAQAPDPASDAMARQLFDVGEQEFAAGRFAQALEHFEEAYELSRRPALLYNIALCNERLGRDAAALEGYERYLREDPNPLNRAEVERRVSVERERVARAAAPAPGASTDVGPIILGSVGAALAVGGAVLLGIGVNDRSVITGALPGTREWTDAERDLGTADLLTALGATAIGLGAVGLGVAIGWGASEPAAPVVVGLAPGGLVVTGSF